MTTRSKLIYDVMICTHCCTLFDVRKADAHETLPGKGFVATGDCLQAECKPACPYCGSTDIEHEDAWATRAAAEIAKGLLLDGCETRLRTERYKQIILEHAPDREAETDSETKKPYRALEPGQTPENQRDETDERKESAA